MSLDIGRDLRRALHTPSWDKSTSPRVFFCCVCECSVGLTYQVPVIFKRLLLNVTSYAKSGLFSVFVLEETQYPCSSVTPYVPGPFQNTFSTLELDFESPTSRRPLPYFLNSTVLVLFRNDDIFPSSVLQDVNPLDDPVENLNSTIPNYLTPLIPGSEESLPPKSSGRSFQWV